MMKGGFMEVNKKLLLGAVVVAILIAVVYIFQSNAPTVSAQGYSSIKVQPDLTSVVIAIETKDASASVAQEKNKAINDRVLEKLASAGIASEDISVGSYTSSPDYDYSLGTGKLKGYIVRQELKVKVAEFSSVGKVIDATIAGGGVVSYVSAELSVEKQNSYKADALAMASKDARTKAEATASGLGKKIGSLVSVQPQEFGYMPMPYYAKGEGVADSTAAADVRQAVSNLNAQEIEVTASVIVEYKLRRF